jgi:hypothetical protein
MEKIKKQKILSKLKSDEHYYGDFGKQYLSNSNIGTLINNPKAFLEPMEDNINFLFGKAFHELIMFGETQYSNFVDASTRTTNIYKEASLESGGLLFLKKEWDEVNYLVESTLKNTEVKNVLNLDNIKFEVPNIGILNNIDEDEDNGLIWKCKADIVSDDFVYDIKTSSSISGFKYSSKSYNYDSQSYIYSTMFQKPMRFIVIEKGTGNVAFYDVSNEAYENGREKMLKAESNYLKYFVNKTEKLEDFTIYGEI